MIGKCAAPGCDKAIVTHSGAQGRPRKYCSERCREVVASRQYRSRAKKDEKRLATIRAKARARQAKFQAARRAEREVNA